MLMVRDFQELERADIDIRQALRISRSRKKYAVIQGDKLHLVNDLERLIFDTLRGEDLYTLEVYQLR